MHHVRMRECLQVLALQHGLVCPLPVLANHLQEGFMVRQSQNGRMADALSQMIRIGGLRLSGSIRRARAQDHGRG